MACFVLAAVFSLFLYANKIWPSVCASVFVCVRLHMRAQVSSVLASASALPITLATYAAGRGEREKPLSGNLHECRAEQGKAERGRGVVLIAQKNNVACAQPVITSGCTHALTHSLACWLSG